MKLVFDSGPLISLSNTCLLNVLDYIPGEFYITPAVYKEVYGHPHTKKIYAWSAENINELIGKKILVQTLSARDLSLVEHLDHVLNTVFYSSRGPIRILQRGELEAVVLASRLDKILIMDERTLRLVIEDPDQLRGRLGRKIHSWVKVNQSRLEEARQLIRDIFVARSVDLVAYAYEKGFLHDRKDPKAALRAALYALKYHGCAVSEDEIERFLKTL